MLDVTAWTLGTLLPLLLAVAWILWRWTEPADRPRILGSFGLLALGSTILAATWTRPTEALPFDRPTASTSRLATDPHPAGYIGSDSCRTCHQHEHATWHASYHRRMTRVASDQTILPPIDDLRLGTEPGPAARTVRLWRTARGTEVELEQRRRDGFAQDEFVRRTIALTTGSHHFQAFWYPTGRSRELALVPYCYRIDESMWMPVSAAFLMPPDIEQPIGHGRWNTTCDGCHATGVQRRLTADGRMDTRVAEFGIACEACHGPGAEHVAKHRAPWTRYRAHFAGRASTEGDGDPTIANPARMTPSRSAQTCGQCHSVSMPKRRHFDAWQGEGAPYRPGDDLHRTRVVVSKARRNAPELRRHLRTDPKFLDTVQWSDGTIRVSGREYNGLLESPCFNHDDESRQMTCASCHVLHPAADHSESLARWADGQVTPKMRGNAACTQCHEALRDAETLTRHTHHATGSSGSECYNCHMSYTSYGLLKALRSHTITSPKVADELATGRPNACNQCHLDRTLQWTTSKLHEWFDQPQPELDEDHRTTADSILWALRGDAGQRALAAWSFGWEPARRASNLSTRGAGEHSPGDADPDWATPILAELMDDPYHAVRFIAWRSLKSAPRFAHQPFSFMAAARVRRRTVADLRREWRFGGTGERPGEALGKLLIRVDGTRAKDRHADLLRRRDRRRVQLAE